MDFSNLTQLSHASSFAFSAENPSGERNGGSHGCPWEKLNACVSMKPGETRVLVDVNDAGELLSMWFGGYVGWELILRIYWDDQNHPSVEVPLSAFFGYLFHENIKDISGKFPTLNSAVALVAPCIGANAYWPMPFRKHCIVTLENRSINRCYDSYYMITGCRRSVDEDCAYFHAAYRQARPVDKNAEYTILDGVKGQGHFAGTALFASLNGNNGCWVEGEAKMYIDSEIYPSINYTGTEDYFGGSYAWGCDSQLGDYQQYSGNYCGMFARFAGTERYLEMPRFMAYRWHIPDPIFFSQTFKMTLQNLGNFKNGMKQRHDDYASTAYWYQSLPSAPLMPLPEAEAVDWQ